MSHLITRSAMSLALVLCTFCVSSAGAQQIYEGRTAFDNLGAGRSPGRVPGAMVGSGFARAQQVGDDGRSQVAAPVITETSHPTEPRTGFIVAAVEAGLNMLNRTLALLGNRWAARAGLMELIPADLFFTVGADGTLDSLLDLLGGGSTAPDPTSGDTTPPDDGGRTPPRGR